MKLAIVSGRPPSALRREWSSAEAAELYAADRCGLLPNWWVMMGVICSVVAGDDREPQDFIPEQWQN